MWLYKNSPEKREKNTASKFLCMTGRPVLEPEEKILFLIIKNCGEISQLGEFVFRK
jgi:hypothetical protein